MNVLKLFARMLATVRVAGAQCDATKDNSKISAPDLQGLQNRCGMGLQNRSGKGKRKGGAGESGRGKKSRFLQRLERAMMPRCRKHKMRGLKRPKFVRPKSHLEALAQDMATDPRQFGRDTMSSFFNFGYDHTRQSGGEVLVRAAGSALVAGAMDAGEAAYRLVTAKRRAAALEARRKYYDAENEKRRQEAEEIRAAVPPPENPMPTPEQLIAAYSQRHDGEEAKVRFGRLMIDLDEHVRYRLVQEKGRIVGSSGGVREWMAENCPELLPHYHTCQRFKRKLQDDPALAENRD